MAITAASLIARVSAEGVLETEAQLLGAGKAAKSFEEMSRMAAQNAAQALGRVPMMVAPMGTAVRTAEADMSQASASAEQMGGRFAASGAMVALAAAAVVAGLVVAGAASVKMAADFQQGVNRLRTGAGDMQDSFATLSSGILKVSVMSRQMAGPLTSAMYLILSATQRGA